MTRAADPGQIVFEARFDPADFARGHVTPWADLPGDARAKWTRAGEAVAGAVRAEIAAIGDKVMDAQVRQAERIAALEAALKPFAELAEAIEQNVAARDDRWSVARVRDVAITHADLKRARRTLRP